MRTSQERPHEYRLRRKRGDFWGGVALCVALALALPLTDYLPNPCCHDRGPAGWRRWLLVEAFLLTVLLVGFIYAYIAAGDLVSFGPDGVTAPGIRGRRHIPWSEVERAYVEGRSFVLVSVRGTRIQLNLMRLKDLDELSEIVARHLAYVVVGGQPLTTRIEELRGQKRKNGL